jgi:hypothetical protein
LACTLTNDVLIDGKLNVVAALQLDHRPLKLLQT